jgi:uncharacterized membrane protein
MKKLLCIGVVALAAAVGCNVSGTGGDPTNAKGTFRLEGPTVATAIKQGDSQSVKVSIVAKGSDFKQDVKLKAEAPKGVTVDLPPVLKASDKEVEMKVTVAADAPTGDEKIHIIGTPAESGNPVPLDITVKIEKK